MPEEKALTNDHIVEMVRGNPSVAKDHLLIGLLSLTLMGFRSYLACSSSSPSVKLNDKPKWPGIEDQSSAPRRTEIM